MMKGKQGAKNRKRVEAGKRGGGEGEERKL